jgi:hypothetical protein
MRTGEARDHGHGPERGAADDGAATQKVTPADADPVSHFGTVFVRLTHQLIKRARCTRSSDCCT